MTIGTAWELPKKRRGRKPRDLRSMKRERKDEKLPETLQGKPVDSKEEGRFGLALMMLKIPFDYQVPVMGGRAFPGGQVIDFLVRLPPKPTPVYVQSTYWHGPGRGKLGQEFLKQQFVRRRMAGWADPVEVWDYQLRTVSDALRVARKIFGRGY